MNIRCAAAHVRRAQSIVDERQASRESRERESDDGKIIAFDPLDQRCAEPLNSVGARLVEPVAARNVCFDDIAGQRDEPHAGRLAFGQGPIAAVIAQGKRRVNAMVAARQCSIIQRDSSRSRGFPSAVPSRSTTVSAATMSVGAPARRLPCRVRERLQARAGRDPEAVTLHSCWRRRQHVVLKR